MKALWNRMKEQPQRWIFRMLLIAFLVSLVPLLYLSRYAVPGCDDYTYGVKTHGAWIATHSVWEVLKAAAETTADYWHHWQGTYSSIFLMTLSPGIGNERWYFLTTFLMTGMLGGSIWALVHVVLKKYVCGTAENPGKQATGEDDGRKKENGYRIGICVIVLVFLSLQTMVAASDGLYWYNGALHYVFMESVLFFQMAVLLSCRCAQKRSARIGWLILSCLLAFVLGGANLLSGLQACILTAFLLLYSLLMLFMANSRTMPAKGPGRALCLRAKERGAKERAQLWVILPLLVNLAGFGFNVLAPGNTIRETTAEGMGAVKAVILSFYWAAVFVTEWVTPIVLAGFFLLLPVIWQLVKKSEAKFFHPAVPLVLSYCVFAAMFTPTLFATSSEGPDRCKNVMRVALYLLLFFNLVNALGWLGKRKEAGALVRLAKEAEKSALPWMLTGAACMGAIFLLAADKNTYTSISALRSVLNGEAAQFYEENEERFALYNDESLPDVTITKLEAKPYLLFKEDVGNEGSPDYWINISVVAYYQLNSLTVAEETE